MTPRGVIRCPTPGLVLAALVILPFLHKPFSVDDVTFLLESKHLVEDPLHPAAFTMVFHGLPTRVSTQLVSGPVMALLLLPSVLHHGAEWIAHAVQLAMLMLGVLATVSLALRLGFQRGAATLAGLLTVGSTAVLGMAATGMPDVPAMSFGALGVERLLAWKQSRRPGAGLAAAAALALAVLSRPQLLLLFGCVAPVLLDGGDAARARGHRFSPRALLNACWPLVASLMLLLAVDWITRDPAGGRSLAVATAHRFHQFALERNAGNLSAQWVVSFPLAVLWVASEWRSFWRSRAAQVALLAGLGLGLVTPTWRASWWILPVTALGTAVLVHILAQALCRRDRVELMLGLWLLLALPAIFYDHLPPKYLVPSAPAMALLLAPRLAGRRRLAPLVASVLAIEVVVGVLVIRADAALAEIGRRGAAEYVAPAVAHGERVWLDGAWGFQWYAMEAGAQPLMVGPPDPAPGDRVVVSLKGGRIDRLPHKHLEQQWIVGGPGGRVLSEGAGFFSNTTGTLPWTWGSGELGRVEVWRVDAPAR